MEVVVLLAGVVDPKWRIDRIGLRADAPLADETGLPRKLSPFDEAALETALQLRDADTSLRVTAALVGDATNDALLRAVAAHRPDRAFRYGDAALSLWDPGVAIGHLRAAIAVAAVAPALVLIGREFGDSDDGLLPAALAESMGADFCGLAHGLRRAGDAFEADRMRGQVEERLHLTPPTVASITNHRGNRLRHPLMKHVVLARRAAVEVVSAVPPAAPGQVTLHGITVAAPPARARGQGRILHGATAANIAALAAALRPERRAGAA